MFHHSCQIPCDQLKPTQNVAEHRLLYIASIPHGWGCVLYLYDSFIFHNLQGRNCAIGRLFKSTTGWGSHFKWNEFKTGENIVHATVTDFVRLYPFATFFWRVCASYRFNSLCVFVLFLGYEYGIYMPSFMSYFIIRINVEQLDMKICLVNFSVLRLTEMAY